VPEPSAFEVELAIEKLNSHKSSAELIKVGGKKFAMRSINLLFLFGIRRNCLRIGRSRSLYLSIKRVIKQLILTIGAYYFCKIRTKFIQHPAVQVNSICKEDYWRSSIWISTQQVNY